MKMKKTFKLFVILLLSLFLISCEKKKKEEKQEEQNPVDEITQQEADELYNAFIKDVKDEYIYNEQIILHENEAITYSFDKPQYLDNLLIIYKSERDAKLVLSVQIDKFNYQKTITIKQDLDTLFDKIFEYIEGYIPNEIVTRNLNLPDVYFGDKEVEITYISSNPEFVTNDGKRVDHEYDELVTITAQLKKNDYSKTKDYVIESIGIDYNERYARTLTYLDEYFNNTELTEGTILPTELPNFGGRFRWLCDDPTVIYDYKTIHLPKVSKTTHLLVEIIFGNTIYKLLKYEVNLNKRPENITDEIYVKTFFETIIKETIEENKGYVTLYQGSLPNITTDKIIDIETAPVHLFTYKEHQPVSQSILDELFYEGYTIPNEHNVTWIVVHETGVSYAGKDAKFFAEAQWDKAQGDAYNDTCSWHYTVDDHSIWQSYSTLVPLWHAADGRKEGGGNVNGIGIEMCINPDGNFELSIRNNARLMASLLIEYNLGMINMRRHHDFYAPKICPQTLIHDKRWYEYLTLIEREYISQTILKDMNIEFDITNLEATSIEDVYKMNSNSKITLFINHNPYVLFDFNNVEG